MSHGCYHRQDMVHWRTSLHIGIWFGRLTKFCIQRNDHIPQQHMDLHLTGKIIFILR